MTGKARKFVRVTKFLLAGVTVFCVCWIASINEWHAGVRWSSQRGDRRGLPTMRTIVAYSEEKQAEMDRPSPVSCDRLPAFPQITYFNRTWSPGVLQESSWQLVPGTRVSLYNAYYDGRTAQRYVRILAMVHGLSSSIKDTLFCQTRSLNPYENTVEVVGAKLLDIWWHQWDATSTEVNTPVLLSCPLTEAIKTPSVISVVTEPCNDPTNAFALNLTRSEIKQKRNFTICVKDMDFDKDISQRLVEWIETNKILGADIIDMYIDKISKETESVLQHYRDEGYIRLHNVPVHNDPANSLWQRRRDHIITYNDCLYRNIEESEFIIPLDVDEVILPKTTSTWRELIPHLYTLGWNPREYSAVMIQNVFFFDVMQRLYTDKNKNVHDVNVTEKYAKRDDVRITEDDYLDLSKIELLGDNHNSKQEYVDVNNEDEIYYARYRERCGHDLVIPKLVTNIVSSAVTTPVGFYSKSFMHTDKVLTAFNHYPLASLATPGFNGWSAPITEVQMNHYKESCNRTVVVECGQYLRRARYDRAALRLRRKLLQALAYAVCTKINYI